MRRKRLFIFGILVLSIILPFWFTSCPTRDDGGGIVLYPFAMSEIFNLDGRAASGGNEGWLRPSAADPRVWEKVPDSEGGRVGSFPAFEGDTRKFYGMRMFNIDRNLGVKRRMDLSIYDGIYFKYRASAINTELRMLDCGFWWAYANRDNFPEYNWQGRVGKEGFEGDFDPDAWRYPCPELGYKEVYIPFYRMWRWGIPQADSVPCNDSTKFQPNNFRSMRFDGRNLAQAGHPLWLEIVDFAFFKYE